ncbi:hypothetical protein PoB_006846300 [Plakobranchus ocellatus]|uniref:Uncharacterized protein n=1 Tax=Plakobranchus ocellatus TaxID=259542 RepID=A0AAV4DCK7_9GAST|nr:hypothetical protein PoB_006846300 [Plakobranchus ocellatus]
MHRTVFILKYDAQSSKPSREIKLLQFYKLFRKEADMRPKDKGGEKNRSPPDPTKKGSNYRSLATYLHRLKQGKQETLTKNHSKNGFVRTWMQALETMFKIA